MARIQGIVALYRDNICQQRPSLGLCVEPPPSESLPQITELRPAYGDHDPNFRSCFLAPQPLLSAQLLQWLGGGSHWLKWAAIGTAAAATVGGVVVYNVARRPPDGEREDQVREQPPPHAGSVANEITELDRVEAACLDMFQVQMQRSLAGSQRRGTETTTFTFFQDMGNALKRAVTFLRGNGLVQCTGYNDFGIHTGACQILAGFGGLMSYEGNSGALESEILRFTQSGLRLDQGPAVLTMAEVAALRRNPLDFKRVLQDYIRRICLPGALRPSSSPPTAPAYGTGY